ncbi:MAG: PLP-dependent aminotransferase family protein [Actinomycetaceae bacterium]|nr:PLP-dependent aminotransferase family protein [Actinomycetaceae bacterium]
MLTYDVGQRGTLSLYEYIYRRIRDDVESGVLAPHERLPSKRALAEHLGVSVITIEGAYAQLLAEGYVRSERRRGHYVNELPDRAIGEARSADGVRAVSEVRGARGVMGQDGQLCVLDQVAGQDGVRALGGPVVGEGQPGGELVADFTQAAAAGDDGAFRLWSRAVRATLAQESEKSLFAQLPPKGSRRLREAIAAHLRGLRGMAVDPSRIVVGAGAEYLYSLIVQILGRERGYAIEDPGYPRLVSIYEANGARVRRVRLDGRGMDVAELGRSGAGVAHVMPSHQFPTGIVTSAARRHELLGWAAGNGGFIIEDDYDCEFRLAGRPVPSLQSIDALGAVLYLNTFSKSLSPALRVAYLVLPGALAERFDREFGFYSNTVATPTQLTLARILETGAYERHISRIKTRHRAVRDGLLAALRSRDTAGRMRVENEDAGLHFVLAAMTHRSEREIAALALRRGVRLAPLSECGGHAEPAASRRDKGVARFVMQYGGLDVGRAPEVADVLVRAIG